MNKNISFSSDNGEISRIDLDDPEINKASDEFFETQNDPEQMSPSPKNKDWIFRNIRNYMNIMRFNEKIIGYVLMLPCNKKLMNEFISKEINESALFENIKKIKINNIPEAIYLCAILIKKEFRKQGVATEAVLRSINKITLNLKYKPVLFY